jgi:WD40 repeat protein
MPGFVNTPVNARIVTPDVQKETQTVPPVVSNLATLPKYTPTPVKELPVITIANAGKLVEIQSTPVEYSNRVIWEPGSEVVTVWKQDGLVQFDAGNLKLISEYRLAENTSLLDYDPGSQLMALTSDRKRLDIRSIDGKDIQSISPAGGFGSASFGPGGKHIWVSSMDEFKANAYDTSTGLETASCGGFVTAAPVYFVSPSPSGKWLVWIARATIQLNRLPGCEQTARIGHQDFITAYAFSPGDAILAVSAGGELDGAFQPLLYIYDPATGSQKNVISLRESPAMGVSFTPDSSIIASAGSGLSLWDVDTGREVINLAAPDQRYTAAAFSPDGRLFAAADEASLHIYAISR